MNNFIYGKSNTIIRCQGLHQILYNILHDNHTVVGLELELTPSNLKLIPSDLLQIKLVSFDLWLVPLGLWLAPSQKLIDLGLAFLHRVRIRVRLGLESHGLVKNRIMMDCEIGM